MFQSVYRIPEETRRLFSPLSQPTSHVYLAKVFRGKQEKALLAVGCQKVKRYNHLGFLCLIDSQKFVLVSLF